MDIKKISIAAAVLGAAVLAGYGGGAAGTADNTTAAVTESGSTDNKVSAIDYMVLVNKENPLPDNWEKEVSLTEYTNSLGDEVKTESRAYEAYQKLKKDLEADDVHVCLQEC